MTEWISLVVPWLFVTNALLFAALSVWFLWERRPEGLFFVWAAICFTLGAVPLLD